jgi:hypothetical protein
MSRPGIRDLVGRVMVDEAFRDELIGNPALILARYDLDDEERAAILKAVAATGEGSRRQQARALQAVLMKRWAT